MKMLRLFNTIFLCSVGLSFLSSFAESSFNLFLSKSETEALLGLSAEVTYVKDNTVNTYASGFNIPVPANISRLRFTWYSSKNIPTKYSLAVPYSDPEALHPPKFSVPARGIVPMTRSVFEIKLNCTGKKTAEIGVVIQLNITIPGAKMIMLNFNRTKFCLKEKLKKNVADGNSVMWKKAKKADEIKSVNTKTEDNSVLSMSEILKSDASLSAAEDIEDDDEKDIFETNLAYIIIGSSGGFLLVLFVAMYACYVKSNKSHRSDQVSDVPNAPTVATQSQTLLRVETPKVASSYGNISCGTAGYSSLIKAPSTTTAISEVRPMSIEQQISSIAIDRERICLVDIIHHGTFGQIFHGVLSVDDKKEHILVKTITDQSSQVQSTLLLKEGMFMYGSSHPNIQRIKAVCIQDVTRPLLVYPFISQGNLKLFLQKCKFSPEGKAHTLVTQNIVDMAIQITQAMQYLHKRQIVHKDLATRNCVVDDTLFVRITDTALSRDLFPNDYHCLGDNENRPVMWLPLESLIHKVFTPASDVWSFGVTVWELMTLGMQPFDDIDPFEIGQYLKDGYRLPQPQNCPDELYNVMACCWSILPEDRPPFLQLQDYLQEFYRALNRYI